MFNFKNKKIAIELIELSSWLFKFPTEKNMIYMYPFIETIRYFLISNKKYNKDIGKNIAEFLKHEINDENSLFRTIKKSTFIKIFDNMESFKDWDNFIELFNKEWGCINRTPYYKNIEEWIKNKHIKNIEIGRFV